MSGAQGHATTSPAEAYAARLRARRVERARLEAIDLRHSVARGILAALGAVAAYLAFGPGLFHPAWLSTPIAAFLVIAISHARVLARKARVERAIAHWERGLARLSDRWAGTGEPGDRFLDPRHPCAADLDLFGRGSLFELLCTARTRAGEETLAAWLKTPSEAEVVRARQTAVAELKDRLDLREDLAVLGEEVAAGVHPEALARWSEEPLRLASRAARIVAPGLAAAAVVTLTGWIALDWGPLPFAVAAALEASFASMWRSRVQRVLAGVETPGRDLSLLALVLARIESERFESPLLADLRRRLDTGGELPSRRIARLARLIVLLDSRRNQFFLPLSFLLLWGTQIAFAIEAWRARTGPACGRWLAALGEIEALLALAGYAYERPGDPFAEIADGGPIFEAEAIGHPLLPDAACRRNDLVLGAAPQVLVVSGSNMSGKSTLLRTAGVNAVLALAGAPVRAARLRISPLTIGATLRIQDSLQAGTSRFYAEITRLREIKELSRRPLLFLLDEILHGTNSHDRRIGAEAIVRGFVQAGAIGLVTTHDLALAQVADALAPRAANVHFEDHLEEGRMTFDYRLRPGVVTKSNALELMRAVGLDV